MKVQVLSIETSEDFNIFDVVLLVGANIYTCQVTIDAFKLGGDYVQNASNNTDLWQIAQHNWYVISKIHKLVLALYNGQEVELPVTILEDLPISPVLAGDFREAAFAD
ncbi:MAG: hypothetical protein ACPGWR_27505 [Ardenticatenaceae bacterium]